MKKEEQIIGERGRGGGEKEEGGIKEVEEKEKNEKSK